MPTLSDAFARIVSILIIKLQLAPLVISEQETRRFDEDTFYKQHLAIDEAGDGISFRISLQPKEQACQLAYDLSDPMRKIIAIILTRCGPVEIAKSDIEVDIAYGFTVEVEGRGEQGCTVNLVPEAGGIPN